MFVCCCLLLVVVTSTKKNKNTHKYRHKKQNWHDFTPPLAAPGTGVSGTIFASILAFSFWIARASRMALREVGSLGPELPEGPACSNRSRTKCPLRKSSDMSLASHQQTTTMNLFTKKVGAMKTNSQLEKKRNEAKRGVQQPTKAQEATPACSAPKKNARRIFLTSGCELQSLLEFGRVWPKTFPQASASSTASSFCRGEQSGFSRSC
jgi:hypothetical protein